MAATCKCKQGHLFNATVIADEEDTNVTMVDMEACPECGTDDFDIIEVLYDYDD